MPEKAVTFLEIEESNLPVRFFEISVADEESDETSAAVETAAAQDSPTTIPEISESISSQQTTQLGSETDTDYDIPIPKPETHLARPEISAPESNVKEIDPLPRHEPVMETSIPAQEEVPAPAAYPTVPPSATPGLELDKSNAPVKSPAESEEQSVQTTVRKRRVLIIEDDTIVSTMVKHLLELRGYETEIAGDGRRAIELIDSIPPPNLVLLDVMLPFVNGFELLYRIENKSGWEEVPVLMLSAKTREDDIVRALETGADDYIIKPFQPQELIARINRLNIQD